MDANLGDAASHEHVESVFGEGRAYHAYQARQNCLRQQKSIENHMNALHAEIARMQAEKDQAQAEKAQARAAEERERAEKEAALAEIERLKALLRN